MCGTPLGTILSCMSLFVTNWASDPKIIALSLLLASLGQMALPLTNRTHVVIDITLLQSMGIFVAERAGYFSLGSNGPTILVR